MLSVLVLTICLGLLIRHRRQIDRRRAAYGIAGLSLLLFTCIWWPAIGLGILLSQPRPGEAAMHWNRWSADIGLALDALTGIAYWLLFVAVTNRRKARPEEAPLP